MASVRKSVEGAAAFSSLGYVVNRLTNAADGKFACTENVPCGSPLLALPLDRCWTKKAAQSECPEIALMLQACPEEPSSSALFEADSTWIALHMIHEMKKPNSDMRQAHLKSLPKVGDSKAGSPLLHCDENGLASLEGSRWKEEAKKWMAQLLDDYQTLKTALGKKFAFEQSEYSWARLIVQQYGTQFMGENGLAYTVVIPGFNLIALDTENTPASSSGARLESTDVSDKPTLVLYAEKDYSAKEEYKLSHGGLSCSAGCRLMTCGKLLSSSKCESVELQATLVVDMMPKQGKSLSIALDGTAALFTDASPPPAAAGECVAPDALNGELPVKMVDIDGKPALSLTVRFSSTCLVPTARALAILGTVLTYDSSKQKQLLVREAAMVNVLSIPKCQRRALLFLKDIINAALRSYPGSAAENSIGWPVVTAEQKLLKSALLEVSTTLENLGDAGIEATATTSKDAEVLNDLKNGICHSGSPLGKVLQSLRKHKESFEEICTTFKSSRPSKKQGESLVWELDILQKSLSRCPLGDPMDALSLPVLDSTDEAAAAFQKVAAAMLNACVEAQKWEYETLPTPSDNITRACAAAKLVKIAQLQMRLLDFDGAKVQLKKSVVLSASAEAMRLAGECTMALTARSASLLDVKWDSWAEALRLLRQKLKGVGYTKPGVHWSYPARLPVIMKFGEESELSDGALQDAFRLFMMHGMVPMGKMVELLGKKVSTMLLQCGVVSCYNASEAGIVEASEAVNLVSKRPELPISVFSNVMLWPLQEDLIVAFDFEQLTSDTSKFDPVPCLAEDSHILMSGAPRSKCAAVLHAACGSGAQGFIALKNYAERVVFLDTNKRALRFAEFSAFVNGLQKKATFINGSLQADGSFIRGQKQKGEFFDTILMCLTGFPKPPSITLNGGSAFASGADEDFGKSLSSSAGILAPGGRLVTTCMVPNIDGISTKLKSWVGNSGVSAVVLPGERSTVSKYANLATAGSALGSAVAFLNGLKTLGIETVSQAVIMLWKPRGAASVTSIDVRAEHLGLWKDSDFVFDELQGYLDQLVLIQANVGNENKVGLYDMDWPDEDNAISTSDQQIIPPMDGAKTDDTVSCWSSLRKPTDVPNGRLASLIQPKGRKEYVFPVSSGATWKDMAAQQVFGYPVPCLADQLWRKVEIPLGINFPASANAPDGATRIPPSNFKMALVEVEGCGATPEIAEEAMQSLDCYDTLVFESRGQDADGGRLPGTLRKKCFGGWRKKLKDGEAPPNMLDKYDTFVFAFGERGGKENVEWWLPQMMREFLNFIMEYVMKNNVAKRVVVLTCGANGPTFPDGPMQDMVHAAAPLRGLFRCARQEVTELPILTIDTDQMSASSGSAEVLADQVSRELEAYTPKEGLAECKPEQFSEAVYRTHREVAWRKGERFFPGWVVSARNPIHLKTDYAHCTMPPDEVCFITGGTGGLGVVTAEALVECGLRCVVLSSRGGKLYEGQGLEDRVAKMEAAGCKVVLAKCDTSSEQSILDALALARTHGKLKHVLHAAGISHADVEPCFRPKVKGAWWLHKHTLDDKLDTYVVYASMTEFIGTAGMSAYAQANTYMEELCRQRHAMGLNATAIEFPEVIGAGMAEAVHQGEGWDVAAIHANQVNLALKQIIAGSAPIGPLIGMVTLGFLLPRPPISFIQHAPLYERRNFGLWARLKEMEAKIGKKKMNQLRAAMQAVEDKAELANLPLQSEIDGVE